MKRDVRRSKKTYNNRLLYSLITLGVLLIVAVGVYAANDWGTAGGSSYYPNPGHTIQQMQPCASSGDILQVNSTGNWSCVSFSSVPSVNLSLSSASLGLSPDPYGKISLGYPNDMKFDGGSDGVFVFYNSNVGGDTRFKIGSTDVFDIKPTGVYVNSGLGYYYSSDRRLKTNITVLQDPLQKIEQLQGVSFNWKSNGASSMGVIAQNVQQVYPQLVSNNGVNGTLAVNYIGLIAPLIDSIKAQQKEINDLQKQIDELKTK